MSAEPITQPIPAPTPAAVPVSVLVATRDRPEDLARCLPTILANDYPDFEVVVIDQSTTDASERVVRALADPRLRYHRQAGTGRSRALNWGLRLATGAVLAFTDDDCTVPPDWLRRGVAVLQREPDAGMVAGALTAAPHDWRTTFIPAAAAPRFRRNHGLLARLRDRHAVGANMVVHSAVFERIGGFDELLGTGARFRGTEDQDIEYRALVAGWVVIDDPDNAVVHWGGRSYADGSARSLMRGYWYGIGVYLAKHIRCGDLIAVYALLRMMVRESFGVISNLVRWRRPLGVGRLVYLLRGVWEGCGQPVDRRRRVFVPAHAEHRGEGARQSVSR